MPLASWDGPPVVDDPGLILLPAFDDNHSHFILAAEGLSQVPADQARSIADLVELIRQRAARTPPGQWVKTSNAWHESNLAEKRLPTALELDQATQVHPVWVKRGGHIGAANSLALRLANITRDTPDPEGGTIKRLPDGTPSGVLVEAPAWTLVQDLVPPPPFQQQVDDLRQVCRIYNRSGIGTLRDPIVSRGQRLVYQALREQGDLSVRCRPLFLIARDSVDRQIAAIQRLGPHSGFGDDWLKLWGLKAVMDGGASGAALDQPYTDDPSSSGKVFWKAAELAEAGNFAVRHGWRIATHAIGDRAVRTLLDAYEQIVHDNPGLKPGTLVIEHALLADATQRARAIRLGVWISAQPPLLYALGGEFLARWGPERTAYITPLRAWLEEGAQVSAGTDSTGTGAPPYDPLLAVWSMVTRGTQHVGVQGAEYAIDRFSAIRLYTLGSAQLNWEDHRRGTLQPGRLADVIAYRNDPLTCPIDELVELRPVWTMVGGRAVFDPEGLISGRDSGIHTGAGSKQ